MRFCLKTLVFSFFIGTCGCAPQPSAPIMMHTATGMIPLVVGEDPVKNVKGTPLEANISDFLTLKGFKAPPQLPVGQSSEITLIWQIKDVQKLKGKKVFVHGHAPGAEQNQLSADHPLLSGKKSAPKIQNGDFIQDRFKVKIPAFFVGEKVQLFTGIYAG